MARKRKCMRGVYVGHAADRQSGVERFRQEHYGRSSVFLTPRVSDRVAF